MNARVLQGSQDHAARLQSQVTTRDSTLEQIRASSSRAEAALSQAQAELQHTKAELTQARGDSEQASAELRQQLETQRAEVLRLKEHQGGSSKASDVIHALEVQVTGCSCST